MAEPKEETFKNIEELIEKRFPGAEYRADKEIMLIFPFNTYTIIQDGKQVEGAYDCPECGVVPGMWEQDSCSTSLLIIQNSSHKEKRLADMTPKEKARALIVAHEGYHDPHPKIKVEYHCRVCKTELCSPQYQDDNCC